MKTSLFFTVLFLISMSNPTQAQSIYDFSLPNIQGEQQSLADYKGKVLLIVNVASRCGLTPQYEDLQALYAELEDQGLVVLGFPANNFMGQEPGTNEDIASFCSNQYGVSFPMFAKISVKGQDQHALYQYLEEKTGQTPSWNFQKYLVDATGERILAIPPQSRVSEPKIKQQILSFLES